MLNLLRFHVSEACSTAKACPAPSLSSMLEALESLVGGSIVALDSAAKFNSHRILPSSILRAFSRKRSRFATASL